MTTALMLPQGANIAWLENQTGVAYATLRRHYAKWMTGERTQLAHFAAVAPWLLVEGPQDAAFVTPGNKLAGQFGAEEHAR